MDDAVEVSCFGKPWELIVEPPVISASTLDIGFLWWNAAGTARLAKTDALSGFVLSFTESASLGVGPWNYYEVGEVKALTFKEILLEKSFITVKWKGGWTTNRIQTLNKLTPGNRSESMTSSPAPRSLASAFTSVSWNISDPENNSMMEIITLIEKQLN